VRSAHPTAEEDKMTNDEIDFHLPRVEALILFEFLSRFRDNDRLDIVDQAEERVLWNLLSKLESKLVDPFKPNYLDLLKQARDEIRDEEI
jgi:hypothetical protein